MALPPPLISTPPVSSTYPPICSPMWAVLPSMSVAQRSLQYGKIHQTNSSSPGSTYPVSTRLHKQAASVSHSPPPAGRSTLLLALSPPHTYILPTPALLPSTKTASHVGGTTDIGQIGQGPVTSIKFYGLPPVMKYYKDFPFKVPHLDSLAPFYCVTKGRCVGVIATW